MKKSEALSAAVTFIVLTLVAITMARLAQVSGDHVSAVGMTICAVVFGFPAVGFIHCWAKPDTYVEHIEQRQARARVTEDEQKSEQWLRKPATVFLGYQLFK